VDGTGGSEVVHTLAFAANLLSIHLTWIAPQPHTMANPPFGYPTFTVTAIAGALVLTCIEFSNSFVELLIVDNEEC
jgi:hypothetical protein